MSTNVGMSSCCISGFVHSGTPSGREDTIGGLPTYIAEPADGKPTKSVIFLTDIFGWRLKNTRLLADNYARNGGFYVYVPDVQSGDSLPEEFLQSAEPPLKIKENQSLVEKTKATADVAATLGPWLIKHREGVSEPIISGFVNTVRHIPGTDKVGVIGFCWGGRYAILQAHGKKDGSVGGDIDAAVAFHPSLVAVPGDFQDVKIPLFIGAGSQDSLTDLKTTEQFRDVLEKREGVATEVKIYEDQVHGFAIRSDWSSQKDKEAMDQAEKDGIAWFKKYLG